MKNSIELLQGETLAVCHINENYLVSSLGRVFKKPFSYVRKDNIVTNCGYREMHIFKSTKGYKITRIEGVSKLIHRLVYLSFYPSSDISLQINHIDGNKENNDLANLELCTPKANINHAFDNGLMARTKVDCFNLSGEYVRTYDSVKILCDELGVFNTNVYSMMKGNKYPKQIKGFIFKKSIDKSKM